MLNAFKDLLCSKLCWHDRPGPNLGVMYIVKDLILYSCTRRSSEVECMYMLAHVKIVLCVRNYVQLCKLHNYITWLWLYI